MQNGMRRTQSRSTRITDRTGIARKPEITTGEMIIFPVINAGNQDIWQESAGNQGKKETKEKGEWEKNMLGLALQLAKVNSWFPAPGFHLRIPTTDSWQLKRYKKLI